ncbi:DNA-3-methyladenine glycosylase family protein [Paractinoplanes atraurantiacus]|uniref:DNA-3-methyladenine glycosylase II n=1 Tax=Paractinoplanes atraurantiacus TaxID=1036182 RepID=A0A285K3P8_9ACTN|nr:DNA-3-methyladenine glycosylase [Actinoplanes atraurantiacus]SNY67178.1 DNA-3-methyladenine glycosylase II [Actinoplanes atraurantiacus]
MARLTSVHNVQGPWSLAVCRAFWEGFGPAALRDQPSSAAELRTVFRAEHDWTVATATVRQDGPSAHITVEGPGDLDAATAQVVRFLSLDIDARGWPSVGDRDPVMAEAQKAMPGLRPCGFLSPYEAAAWAVLTQRVRRTQAAQQRAALLRNGAFPAPQELRALDLDLFGRKTEYLHAVAEAALDGRLDGSHLRALDAPSAVAAVREITGLGPFGAELVVLRGANHPDAVPHHEPRFQAELTRHYGSTATRDQVSEAWRPYRTWAAFHLRAQAGMPAR